MFWFSDNGFPKKGKVGRVFIFCFYFQSNMGRVFIFCYLTTSIQLTLVVSLSRTSLCIHIYNLTPVESNSDESKFRLSRMKVLVLRCRKPYYLHSLSQIYLSKHVYYLGVKIGSQVKHPVIDFDIFTLGYFTCLF
jgi:hypothetical protein